MEIIADACTQSAPYVTGLVLNGLIIGVIYALMGLGLTLIFSVLGIVSFAHGEHYMIGGFVAFFLLEAINGLHPLLAVVLAGVATFIIGVIFERLFLRPMHEGKVERPGEYAILVTFGFAFFLQYLTLAIIGPFPKKAQQFFDLSIPRLFGSISVFSSRVIAAVIALALIGIVLWFVQRTWAGRALRATSQDNQAAAVTGINPANMNTLAFGLGTMLAGMSGATLVQVFSWTFDVGIPASAKSFVIIVLGGMGSIPGALAGGLIVGVVEGLGTGCFPDPNRGLAYQNAFGILIMAIILLLRPQGLFGRKL
ncbi:MAG: branched-chain amino acid ABC transporter permease [Anaerolineae bacterium]|nr:branched-chain amino acid ABC transporter permease [Anaerolineae bacterium]